MNKVALNVLGISYSQVQTGTYVLVLGEESGNRRIPIIIGGFEAQAIAIQLQGVNLPRPMTHDLFYNFAMEYGISIDSVCIFRLEEGIFYSKLICTNGGKRVELDARTSDSIALALRFHCPIYTTAEIMERASIVNDPLSPTGQPAQFTNIAKQKTDMQHLDVSELETMLNEAIANEDYEQASKIHDEIKRKKSNL